MSYVSITPQESGCQPQCLLPQFTAGVLAKATDRIGIGSVWRCPRCGAEWRLAKHDTSTHGSSWTKVKAGQALAVSSSKMTARDWLKFAGAIAVAMLLFLFIAAVAPR